MRYTRSPRAWPSTELGRLSAVDSIAVRSKSLVQGLMSQNITHNGRQYRPEKGQISPTLAWTVGAKVADAGLETKFKKGPVIAMPMLTVLAQRRLRQRGIPQRRIANFIEVADRDVPIGNGCTLLAVSSELCQNLPDGERLRTLRVIQAADGEILTAFHHVGGKAGQRYRYAMKGKA